MVGDKDQVSASTDVRKAPSQAQSLSALHDEALYGNTGAIASLDYQVKLGTTAANPKLAALVLDQLAQNGDMLTYEDLFTRSHDRDPGAPEFALQTEFDRVQKYFPNHGETCGLMAYADQLNGISPKLEERTKASNAGAHIEHMEKFIKTDADKLSAAWPDMNAYDKQTDTQQALSLHNELSESMHMAYNSFGSQGVQAYTDKLNQHLKSNGSHLKIQFRPDPEAVGTVGTYHIGFDHQNGGDTWPVKVQGRKSAAAEALPGMILEDR